MSAHSRTCKPAASGRGPQSGVGRWRLWTAGVAVATAVIWTGGATVALADQAAAPGNGAAASWVRDIATKTVVALIVALLTWLVKRLLFPKLPGAEPGPSRPVPHVDYSSLPNASQVVRVSNSFEKPVDVDTSCLRFPLPNVWVDGHRVNCWGRPYPNGDANLICAAILRNFGRDEWRLVLEEPPRASAHPAPPTTNTPPGTDAPRPTTYVPPPGTQAPSPATQAPPAHGARAAAPATPASPTPNKRRRGR